MPLLTINRDPSPGQLRVFAAAWLAALGLAALSLLRHHHPGTAEAVAVAAVVVPAAGAVRPALLRIAYLGLSYATYPVGWVVSHVVLALVYFGVVSPIGLAMRLLGRDPLDRTFDAAAASYWRPRAGSRDPAGYFRQD